MKQLFMEFKKMDHSIIALVKSGIKFCFGILVVAAIILLAYDLAYSLPLVYYIGISLFKTSLFFMACFIICGIAFNKIKVDLGE